MIRDAPLGAGVQVVSPAATGWSRLLARLEVGRRPHAVALATAGILAALSPVRFAILVARMPAEAYGYLSVFNTLTSLLPYALCLGLPLQFQLVTARHGLFALPSLRPLGLRVVLATSVPALALCYLLALPFSSGTDSIVLAILSVVTSACVAWTMLLSQTLLGLRSRSAAALAMFGYNVLLTIAVAPFALFAPGSLSVIEVMSAWTVASLIGLTVAVALQLLTLRSPSPDLADTEPAPFELGPFKGMPMLPALVGPWMFVMLTRYILGLYAGGEQLATFSLSWTLVDLGFLVAANIPALASTDLMLGRRKPITVFVAATLLLLVLLGGGIVMLELLIATIAPTYRFSAVATLILSVGVVARLAVITWFPGSVGRGREGRVSGLYLIGWVALAVVLSISASSSPEFYSVVLAGAFAFVAIAQIAVTKPVAAVARPVTGAP